jgi:hypothetical protein
MRLHTLSALLAFPFALAAQDIVTVTTAQGNAQQTWYSFENGVMADRPLAEWDMAIELTGITGGIQMNTAKGIEVYKVPYAISEWAAIDTTGHISIALRQHNSETNWSSGALNQGLTSNPFDLGWGIYSMITHNVTGDSCFVIKLANGAWKKLRIDGYASGTDTYTFTWADLDGANEQSNSFVRATYAGRNFAYISLEANTVFDREPASNTWDLLFTRYMAFVPFPVPSMYPVAGVLQNHDIEVQRVNGVTPAFSDWGAGAFSADINRIGFDWKNFNQQTSPPQWEYATDRVHFARDRSGNIWKLVFTTYGGSATGDMTFTQELMSATSVDELPGSMPLALYPNPVADGRVSLVLDAPVSTVDMLVFDASGRAVLTERLAGLGGLEVRTLDVSNLRAGIYTVRLQGEGVLATTRLVVQ